MSVDYGFSIKTGGACLAPTTFPKSGESVRQNNRDLQGLRQLPDDIKQLRGESALHHEDELE